MSSSSVPSRWDVRPLVSANMSPDGQFNRILRAAQAGDQEALAKLYTAIQPAISRYIRAREPRDAEDLASDVWLDVASGLDRFAGEEEGFRAWAFTIARRRMIDHRRKRSRRMEIALEARHDRAGGDVEAEAIGGLTTAAALESVGRLPEEQADIVLLRVLGGLSAEEVGAIIGKRPGTVRVIQMRALRRLARELERDGVTR